MAEVTTVTGIILSAMPVGEYDRRLVILTKECGKISVFAKGARRPNSTLIGVTRPFIFGKFEVYRGRDSFSMYKANAEEYFEEVVGDLDAVCYGYYFAELADYYGRENLDASEMINLLYITLKALTKKTIPYELIRYIYELRLIAINGECPDLFTCCNCTGEESIVGYSFSRNGLYCDKCNNIIQDGIKLSSATLYAIQYVYTTPLGKLYTFVLKEEALAEFKLLIHRLESIVFDKEFKSKEMLNIF